VHDVKLNVPPKRSYLLHFKLYGNENQASEWNENHRKTREELVTNKPKV